jgi:hypothetical protein
MQKGDGAACCYLFTRPKRYKFRLTRFPPKPAAAYFTTSILSSP